MSVIRTMQEVLQTLLGSFYKFLTTNWTRKKVLLVVLLVALVAWLFGGANEPAVEISETAAPEVVVSQVGMLAGGGAFSVTGSVEALAEAQLKAESGGRVVAVNTEIGKFVGAGTIVATLDNATEPASLLQAQGAYEAALAASRQSTVGVAEAQSALESTNRNAVTAVASAYNVTSGAVKTDIDTYFNNPTSALPNLRINAYGNGSTINSARTTLNRTLSVWQTESQALTPTSNLDAAIETSRKNVGEVIVLVDNLIDALQKDRDGDASRIAALSATRGQLLGVQSSLQGTLASLASARDAKSRAEINAGNGTGPSASSAQITQALGAVRAAQAQYEKTLVRTPISGVVNALYIKRGDFVSPMADVAVIANNNGKQVTGAITESDRNLISVGDAVTFNETATGTVTAIAGAVDPKTGKVAVKMSVSTPDLLTTGTTVSVAFSNQVASSSASSTAAIAIPLTAIKLLASGAVVYTVTDDSKLEALPVTLGRVLGDTIIVTEGIDKTTTIVVDVRGRKAGEVVVIKD